MSVYFYSWHFIPVNYPVIIVKFYKQDQSPCFSTAGAEWKQIECTKRFYIGFFAAFLDIYSPHFVRQILQEKLWIPDKKYFMQPWLCPYQAWQHWAHINCDFSTKSDTILPELSPQFPQQGPASQEIKYWHKLRRITKQEGPK